MMTSESTQQEPDQQIHVPPIPEYSVSIPDDSRMVECDQDIANAKTMKALREVARKWKVKGYKKYRLKTRTILEDRIRYFVGVCIGLDIYKDRFERLSEDEILDMIQADDTPILKQVDKLIPVEPEVLPPDDDLFADEDRYCRALEAFAKKRDEHLFRLCDTIPLFLRTLRDQDFDEKPWIDLTSSTHADRLSDILLEKLENSDPYWNEDEAMDLLNHLFEGLNKASLEGFFFGLDVESDRGWGFWKVKPVEELK